MKITEPEKIDLYYQAIVDRNPDFIGIFYTGVKTTSIFCLPTCRARTPKKENVAFYRTLKSALEAGFRPCKICKPTENAEQAPEIVQQAIDWVRKHPKEKITDAQLAERGISPHSVRNWFNKHYGMTFQAFQRMYRINNAFEELKHGKSITNTALDLGYESLSGFAYTYKKLLGKSPKNTMKNAMTNHPILIDRLTSPLGPMFICATEKGLCLLEFTNRRMLETEFEDLQRRLKAPILTGSNPHIEQAKTELAEYFAGKRQDFDVALDMQGTDFQKTVWQALLTIPYGTTASYAEQAQSIHKPKAVRAVANANGANKIGIIIPCHRVIGSDGSLTGYGGGLERKQWLLDLESGKNY